MHALLTPRPRWELRVLLSRYGAEPRFASLLFLAAQTWSARLIRELAREAGVGHLVQCRPLAEYGAIPAV